MERNLNLEDWQNAGFGLYLHWPFCQSKCPYCDFNSHVAGQVDESAWKAAFEKELLRVSRLTGPRVLNTIFFGGGTPSLMSPDIVSHIIESAKHGWTLANDCEITLEANPSSVEAGRFRGYSDAGVNRISMGFQALNDADLRQLGRRHTVREALTAYDVAQSLFDRVSFDLIYARQGQTLQAWQEELKTALSMGSNHLSLYQLTIEEGTVFSERNNRGLLKGLPDEGLAADLFEMTQDICAGAGFHNYEVSNFARPGSESRHNMLYWTAGDYAGIGPGAHGRLTIAGQRTATESYSAPSVWLDKVNAGTADSSFLPLSPADQGQEYLMMGLRMSTGIDLARFNAISGINLSTEKINTLSEYDMVKEETGRLCVTQKGRMLLNEVIRELGTSCH